MIGFPETTPRTSLVFAVLGGLLVSSCAVAPLGGTTRADTPASASALASIHPGEAPYKAYCASCHEEPLVANAPGRSTLARMAPSQIQNAIIQGKMIAQGAMLSGKEVSLVADYLSETDADNDEWVASMKCDAGRLTPNLSGGAVVANYGFDLSNTRNLSSEQTGLAPGDIPRLELSWAIAFPFAVSLRSQPAAVGDTVFLPVGESRNRLFAFDVSDPARPCIQWIYEGGVSYFRSGASFGVRRDGSKVVMVSDVGANVHMIDALTGQGIWVERIGLFANSMGTGTPVLIEDRVIAPSSQYEITQGGYDVHVCCKSHGGVVALDAMTGRRLWTMHTMEDAKPLYDRGDGQKIWGPSGAPVWTSPAIDLERRLIYFGTGEANSPPAHVNTDAVMAISLDDGSVKWSYQAHARDIWIAFCAPGGAPGPGRTRKNCVPDHETIYLDVDFGASMIIARDADGRDMLVAGQKSGDVYAFDPDTGKLFWKAAPGPGGMINWGMAIDDSHVYVPLSGFSSTGTGSERRSVNGVYALDLRDGSVTWSYLTEPHCTDERRKFVPGCAQAYGLTAPTTIVGDHVFAGLLDGRIYALDRKTGRPAWMFDTARSYDTVNGVKGNGGTFGNNLAIASNGQLIVNSGYGVWGVGPGNVALGFRPRPPGLAGD